MGDESNSTVNTVMEAKNAMHVTKEPSVWTSDILSQSGSQSSTHSSDVIYTMKTE